MGVESKFSTRLQSGFVSSWVSTRKGRAPSSIVAGFSWSTKRNPNKALICITWRMKSLASTLSNKISLTHPLGCDSCQWRRGHAGYAQVIRSWMNENGWISFRVAHNKNITDLSVWQGSCHMNPADFVACQYLIIHHDFVWVVASRGAFTFLVLIVPLSQHINCRGDQDR